MALVIGGEDSWTIQPVQILTAVRRDPEKQPRDRQYPGGQAGAARDPRRRAAIPAWEGDGFLRRYRMVEHRPQIAHCARRCELALIEAGSEVLLDRHH